MSFNEKRALEEVDAMIFSGDILYRTKAREELQYYLARWQRAIAAHDPMNDEPEEH